MNLINILQTTIFWAIGLGIIGFLFWTVIPDRIKEIITKKIDEKYPQKK